MVNGPLGGSVGRVDVISAREKGSLGLPAGRWQKTKMNEMGKVSGLGQPGLLC